MKSPSTHVTKPPVTKKQPTKKEPEKPDNGFSIDHAMQLARAGANAVTAYSEYIKETEITKRAQIEGQKAIILAEKDVEKARLNHEERLIELENEDKSSDRGHNQVMEKLRQDDRKLDHVGDFQDRVLKQLESKGITAQDAALLLKNVKE